MVCIIWTRDWVLSYLVTVSCLSIFLSHQLVRIYEWFHNPVEAPPVGEHAIGGILRDLYVLRSRGLSQETRATYSEPLLKESLASMREPAMIVNRTDALVWCNAATEYLLGVNFSDEKGRSLNEIFKSKSLKKYLKNGNFQKPLRIRAGAAPEIILQLEVSRFGADDRLVFMKDVTEQERLEKMRRDFVGNVSHELRTPLTVIKGYLETLPMLIKSKDSVVSQSFASMETQADRMEKLISDLLWLSSVENFEGRRKATIVDMSKLVQDLCREIAKSWPNRDLQLELSSKKNIFGDASELRSAVGNLIENSLKYSGKMAIKISWTDTAVGVTLRIEDQGIGIAAKHIPRLTERFYRVEKSRNLNTGGTGLGLAIVKHVAVSHEAKLFIDSEEGVGSCFCLVFPHTRIAE